MKGAMDNKPLDFKETFLKLQHLLGRQKEIVFAYLHGSFLNKVNFDDIDIAVFLEPAELHQKDEDLEYETGLSLKLEKALSFPIDVKTLNRAPLCFRYHASAGALLLSRDESVREVFLNRTWSEYFDYRYPARVYQEDLNRA